MIITILCTMCIFFVCQLVIVNLPTVTVVYPVSTVTIVTMATTASIPNLTACETVTDWCILLFERTVGLTHMFLLAIIINIGLTNL